MIVEYESCGLRLTISDSGPGHVNGSSSPGHGLVGMRERAALYGGSVTTSEREGGGFVVDAWFPTETSA